MQAKQPHKHAALIKAWADGAQIEMDFGGDAWKEVDPQWAENREYRIKPERVFPKSSLNTDGLLAAYFGVETPSMATKQAYSATADSYMRRIADAAIKQYILDTEAAK